MRGSPRQIAATLRRTAQALNEEVRRAEADSVKEALRIAEELSSGGYSKAALRRLDHPYRIGGSPPADPAIINRQSKEGGFRDSWKIEGPRLTTKGLRTRLVNRAPHARFLFEGTDRMIARPTPARIKQRLAKFRRRRYDEALRRSLGKQ